MCLILLAYKQHPEYPLILAANRDEFYRRPTQPLQPWQDAPHVLAGRDLQAGGTWLGVSADGRLATVTNFRNPTQG
ncbi:MAG: NRDE family protein, partial [Candidatus Competibacteraceae bacterium]|nr:NRDE family protein [Candidatus Competibacteraceae bacterium]